MNCPHCKKDLYVGIEESPIEVRQIYTPAEIMTIKESLKQKIKALAIPAEIEAGMLADIDNENSIFDQDDANQLFEAVMKQYEKAK